MKATTQICGIALALACCLAATLKAQDIYVINVEANTLGEYGLDGSTVNASLVTSASGLGYPYGIAISGDDVFVANWDNGGTIAEYTTSGATVNASLITGLQYPCGIAIFGNDLFVTANGEGTVGEYTTSGVTINASLISGLYDPVGIAISVPEPSVYTLAGLGAALWLWRRRK